MTNLQDGASRISGPVLRRVWLWAPIAIGAALALSLVATVLAPLWVSLQEDSRKLREVEQLKAGLAQQRLTARSLDQQEETVQAQRTRLVKVISGNGEVSTFLAQLDQMAKSNGVQLDLYEPGASMPAADGSRQATPPAPGNAPPAGSQAKPPADPLEVENLQRNALLMAARGSFPQLLAFLRQLESLNVLVVQSDLQLSQEQKNGNGVEVFKPEPVVLKLALSFYGKPQEGEVAEVPTAAAGNPVPNPGTPPPSTPN